MCGLWLVFSTSKKIARRPTGTGRSGSGGATRATYSGSGEAKATSAGSAEASNDGSTAGLTAIPAATGSTAVSGSGPSAPDACESGAMVGSALRAAAAGRARRGACRVVFLGVGVARGVVLRVTVALQSWRLAPASRQLLPRVRYCIRGPPFVTRAILHRARRGRGV